MPDLIRILVVDDEPSVSQSVAALLMQKGYQAETCATVTEARGYLNASFFDLVLLDVGLKNEDGRSLIDYVVDNGLKTQCIVMSGEPSIDVAIDAMRRGAADYLRKPFSPEEVFVRIDAALSTAKLIKQNQSYQKKLKSSEILHRFLVQNSPDLIFILDELGRVSYVNNRFLDVLGYAQESVQGMNFSKLAAPEDITRAAHLLDRSRLSLGDSYSVSGSANASAEIKLRTLHPDVESRTYEVMLMPIQPFMHGGREDKLGGVYGLARDVTDQKRAEAVIAFQATHDLLTRLPNRALFQDRLAAALRLARRDKYGCAVLYIDLDRFKSVNDTLGHGVGDDLLRGVTLRMRGLLRDSDTLARVGGDEFMILLPHIDRIQDVEIVAAKLVNALKQPVEVDGHELYVTASIGAAMYPEHGTQVEELIRHADIAMYEVKNANRDGYRVFDLALGDMSSERFNLVQQLRFALSHDELRLHYQPQIDVETGRAVCMEALVRWQHPSLGLLQPGDFIPVAEESGLIIELDRWVLRHVCKDMKDWDDIGAAPMRVAVNFSAQQFSDPDLVAHVLAIVKEADVDGSRIEIEITETGMLRDMQGVTDKLLQLGEYGFRVALDDFGVGYTSLNYLRNLPVHTVKIDRSFVRDIANGTVDSSIVKAIVSMARGLNMKPLAEGVESREQVDFLASMGCSDMQGFYFSRPRPLEEARQQLQWDVASVLREDLPLLN